MTDLVVQMGAGLAGDVFLSQGSPAWQVPKQKEMTAVVSSPGVTGPVAVGRDPLSLPSFVVRSAHLAELSRTVRPFTLHCVTAKEFPNLAPLSGVPGILVACVGGR